MKEAFLNWLRDELQKRLWDVTKDMASVFMFFVISVAICSGLLYLLKAFWCTYAATATGAHFITLFGSRADTIDRVLTHGLLSLSLSVNVVAVKTCIVGAIVGRLFSLVRYLYEYRGFWGRMLFWVLPLACFSAHIISASYDLGWAPALVLSAISTLVVLSSCIRLVSAVLPEIKTIWGSISSPAQKQQKAMKEM